MARKNTKITVAIIGGGPAGLGAAIELSKRLSIEWRLYEKKPEISEIGNGLSLQPNTWRMMGKMGAAEHIKNSDVFRPLDGHATEHRNGLSGHLVLKNNSPASTLPHEEPCRTHRANLQRALMREVNKAKVFVGHRLIRIEQLASGRLRLEFENGHVDEVDLLVGADGIRSVRLLLDPAQVCEGADADRQAVRRFSFPGHDIFYTGAASYRAVVPVNEALDINGIPRSVIFWHGAGGNWVYTCPLGARDFEVTCKINEPLAAGEDRNSWGEAASVEHLRAVFADFALPIRQLLALVKEVYRYNFFAGPRLTTAISHGAVALIGDASHPLSGAFGAGAGFALEDAHVLGRALDWAEAAGRPLAEALSLFDRVRTPHYNALYDILDSFATAEKELAGLGLDRTEEIEQRIQRVWAAKHNWMYYYDVDAVFDAIVAAGGQGVEKSRL